MRIFYLMKKEIIEILRQKQMIFMIVVSPIFQLILFGYIATTDVKNLPVEIINISNSKYAVEIINRIKSSPLFVVKKVSSRYDNPVKNMKEGKIRAAILFRNPFDKKRNPLGFPEIEILMDGVDSNSSLIAAGYFNGIISNYLTEIMEKKGVKTPIRSKSLIRYNPELKSINYMGPAIVAMLLTVIAIFLTSSSLVREKEQQTIDTLMISRLSPIEIYLGKALPMLLIGILEMFMGVVFVVLWFRIPMKGNMFELLFASMIYLTAILSIALLISTFTKTQQESMFFAWFSMITFILLSGLYTPIENIPIGLRWITYINPLQYLMKIIREIFLKGNGMEFFYKDLLVLFAMGAITLTISLSIFKRSVSK